MASSLIIAEAEPSSAAPPAERSRLRWSLRLAVMVALGVLVWQGLQVFVGPNFHVVIPGKIYRGAQPDATRLKAIIQRHGIRTILNLRGPCYPHEWYVDEAAVVQQQGISLEDINFSAGRWPSHHELRELVDVFDRCEYPMFMHCRHGADRTGMAAVLAVLLYTDTPYAEARRQMSLRYGHAPIGRTSVLDEFFELYEAWLTSEGRKHDAAALRHWLLEVYRGGVCQGVVEEATALHADPRVGQPLAWRVRVHNTSPAPWHFKPTSTAGIHVGYYLWNKQGALAGVGRGGMFEKTVAPGEKLTINLVAPPVAAPGRYRILIDLIEEGHCWFYQTGSEPYIEEFVVRDESSSSEKGGTP